MHSEASQHRTCPQFPPAPPALQLAAALAQQYLQTAHAGWRQSGRMLEKFDALHEGAAGGGGEYACVSGFGWTNGVALLLLERYGWQPGAL
jgi:alpha,alpha-trehalase